MARVTGMPCPLRLCKNPPEVHVHSSNGVFVAVDGEALWCTCSVCELKEKKGGLAILEGSEGRRHPWVRITEGEYKTVTKAAGKQGPLRYAFILYSLHAYLYRLYKLYWVSILGQF